ncbi:hypothetical protein HNP37_002736 [Flavobacterium nitrogenifigens]|uniref:Uncharacterized protein n=2 Tax=Flavobacterium TaxID=237 RepID=A0A7W7IXY8_9FLAO|nr:hypothetical protein [Flavobacterium nitrogenifigens]MBB6387619.1 hypothetical protein [Flavobacterium notoginsengisoli]
MQALEKYISEAFFLKNIQLKLINLIEERFFYSIKLLFHFKLKNKECSKTFLST